MDAPRPIEPIYSLAPLVLNDPQFETKRFDFIKSKEGELKMAPIATGSFIYEVCLRRLEGDQITPGFLDFVKGRFGEKEIYEAVRNVQIQLVFIRRLYEQYLAAQAATAMALMAQGTHPIVPPIDRPTEPQNDMSNPTEKLITSDIMAELGLDLFDWSKLSWHYGKCGKLSGPGKLKQFVEKNANKKDEHVYFDGWKFKGNTVTKHAALFGTLDEAKVSFNALIDPDEHVRTYHIKALQELGYDPNATWAQVLAEYDDFFTNKIWPAFMIASCVESFHHKLTLDHPDIAEKFPDFSTEHAITLFFAFNCLGLQVQVVYANPTQQN